MTIGYLLFSMTYSKVGLDRGWMARILVSSLNLLRTKTELEAYCCILFLLAFPRHGISRLGVTNFAAPEDMLAYSQRLLGNRDRSLVEDNPTSYRDWFQT